MIEEKTTEGNNDLEIVEKVIKLNLAYERKGSVVAKSVDYEDALIELYRVQEFLETSAMKNIELCAVQALMVRERQSEESDIDFLVNVAASLSTIYLITYSCTAALGIYLPDIAKMVIDNHLETCLDKEGNLVSDEQLEEKGEKDEEKLREKLRKYFSARYQPKDIISSQQEH